MNVEPQGKDVYNKGGQKQCLKKCRQTGCLLCARRIPSLDGLDEENFDLQYAFEQVHA